MSASLDILYEYHCFPIGFPSYTDDRFVLFGVQPTVNSPRCPRDPRQGSHASSDRVDLVASVSKPEGCTKTKLRLHMAHATFVHGFLDL
jgi:hypothetical protein